jgi:hypothetical protein
MTKKKIVNRGISLLAQVYEWDGEFNTGYEWSEIKDIKPSTFVRRLGQYGTEDERTFYTNSQMRQYVHESRVAAGQAGGAQASKNYHTKKTLTKLCTPLDSLELAKDKQFLQKACDMIGDMILDAKSNLKLKRNGKRKLYYDESKSWLKNGNGGLEDLLRFTPLHVESSLRELREYADRH